MTVPFEIFAANLVALRATIAEACAESGRDPASVAILPVTKNHPAAAVEYVRRAGLEAVGENRVQEAADKQRTAPAGLRWELIGHLQSNKARLAAGLFDRIQSVDTPKLLDVLERAAAERPRPLHVLLQVNAGHDPAKFGCAVDAAPALLEHALHRCPHLTIDGLMTIAPLAEDRAVARRTFDTLRALRDALAARCGVPLRELSMGMTGDVREAIRAGSTQVRVGTALFGARD
jgi:pyridoxal phosphate enzyme (YggS family)